MEKIAQAPTGVPIGKYFGGYTGTTSSLLTVFVRGSLIIAGVTLLFLILGGGFKIIQGAGSNNPQETAKGKQALTYAIAGLVVIVAAFLVILIIEAIVRRPFITQPFRMSLY